MLDTDTKSIFEAYTSSLISEAMPVPAGGIETDPYRWGAGGQFKDNEEVLQTIVHPAGTAGSSRVTFYDMNSDTVMDPYYKQITDSWEAAGVDFTDRAVIRQFNLAITNIEKDLIVTQPADGTTEPYSLFIPHLSDHVDVNSFVSKAMLAGAGKEKKPGLMRRLGAGALGVLTPRSKLLGGAQNLAQQTIQHGPRKALGIEPKSAYDAALAARK